MNLKGKHALVTGAGKRVGRKIAEALVESGCHLTAHGHHSKKEVEALVTWARSRGVKSTSIFADIKDPKEVQSSVALSVKEIGPVQILINSASIFFAATVDKTTSDDWDKLFDTNLKGQFFFAQAMARHLGEKKGVIVNIGDVNGVRSFMNYAGYSASKAGLIHLTRGLAKELAPTIRVNSLSPGWVLTPENTPSEQVERNMERTLLKRIGTPEDVVSGIKFLVENDYVTGFNLVVDGGRAIL
jgi:pteridine reductase